MATRSESGLQIHLYDAGEISTELPHGRVTVTIATNYPWDGRICLEVTEADAGSWNLSLRIPQWCSDAAISVNGKPEQQALVAGEYAVVNRRWRAGDKVEIDFPMPPLFYEAHPHIDATRCSLAIVRGPMIYCIEGHDQPAGVDLFDCMAAPGAGKPQVEWQPDLLGGVMTVKAPGFAADTTDWKGVLYRQAGSATGGTKRGSPTVLAAIPYYAWANRGLSPMRVWIPAER
jgi:hypothetical protein